MNEQKVVIDINSLNKLINNTIDALDEIVRSDHETVENIIKAACVVKELQQSINENGLKLASMKVGNSSKFIRESMEGRM